MNPLVHLRLAVGPVVLLELAFLFRPEADEVEEEEPREHFQIGFCATDVAPPVPDPVFRSVGGDEEEEDASLPGRRG